jgi:4-hydroxybenzoate polyprenyltransferase
LAAALALAPASLYGPTIMPDAYLLSAVVFCWVAGFDIIYALQDVEVDRKEGLHSMPAKLGVEQALWISRLLHLLSFGAMIALWKFSAVLGHGYLVAMILAGGLLLLEHTLVWQSKTKHIHMAFFTINGVISLLLGALGIADILMSIG